MAVIARVLQPILLGPIMTVAFGEAALADQWGLLLSGSCSQGGFEQRIGDRFGISLIRVDLGDGATDKANELDVFELNEVEDEKSLTCMVGERSVAFTSRNVSTSDGQGECDVAQSAQFELQIDDTVVWHAGTNPVGEGAVPPLGPDRERAYRDGGCPGVFFGSLEVTERYVRLCSFERPKDGDTDQDLKWHGDYLGWSQTTIQTCTMLNTDRLVEAVQRFGEPLKG